METSFATLYKITNMININIFVKFCFSISQSGIISKILLTVWGKLFQKGCIITDSFDNDFFQKGMVEQNLEKVCQQLRPQQCGYYYITYINSITYVCIHDINTSI